MCKINREQEQRKRTEKETKRETEINTQGAELINLFQSSEIW
jgi:hypothetical protein